MSFALADAVTWCARLSAVALALQTLELLQLRAAYADNGIWSWPILAEEQRHLPPPLRWLFAALLPYRVFVGLLVARLLLAALLGLGLLAAAPLLFLSQLAVNARFRGTFNGGSDYMSVVLLLGLSLAAVGGSSLLLAKAGLAYICVQLVLSYFIAGWVKLVQPAWRNGSALRSLLSSSRYGSPSWLAALVKKPGVARSATLGVLLFECGFPLALLGRQLAWPFLALGAVFHLANALAFGLNRFLFAWAAAYPALLYFSAQVGLSRFGQ